MSLAHSMHSMVTILGSETAETDIVPVFDALREDVDEVRGGLLKNLAHLIEVSREDKGDQKTISIL